MIEQKDFTKELLSETVNNILDNKEVNKMMIEKLEFIDKLNPSTIIYNEIIKNK